MLGGSLVLEREEKGKQYLDAGLPVLEGTSAPDLPILTISFANVVMYYF
jgi:hypothetical protein